MRHAQTALTLLLAGTLLFPAGALAGPKAKPLKTPELSPHLTAQEHVCRARGTFAYNQALARDAGGTLTDALLFVREWDVKTGTPPDIRAAHELILRAIYTLPWETPALARQIVELVCLDQVQATTTTPPAAGVKPQDIRY